MVIEEIKNQIEMYKVKSVSLQPWLMWLGGLSAGLCTKGHRFNSQSGHTPGVGARCPVGGV